MEKAVALSDAQSAKVVKCSVKTFLWSNIILGILCLGLLGVATYGAIQPSDIFLVFPQQIYIIIIGVAGFGTIVCFMGLYGSIRNNECCVLCFILFIALGLIAQVLVFVYLLLYANGVATFSALDTSIFNLQKGLETFLVEYSQTKPAEWEAAQINLNCCGVDFEAGCNKTDDFLAKLESGARCSTVPTLNATRALFCPGFDPETSDTIEEVKDLDNIGQNSAFFCKDSFAKFFQENTPFIAGILAAVLIAQISALISSLRLYWVPRERGGFFEEYNEKYGMAKPKTAEEYGGGVKGNIQAFTNRLSYRLNRATFQEGVTPGGGVGSNLMNRLSFRREPQGMSGGSPNYVSQMGADSRGPGMGAPGMGAPGMGAPPSPPPTMFSRLSKRFGGMGAPFGPPRGPPPGPPPGVMSGDNLMNGPPPPRSGMPMGSIGSAPQPSAFKRVSARLQQGISSFGRGMPSFGGPPRPPPPPFGSNGPPPNLALGPGADSGMTFPPPRGGMPGATPPRGSMGVPPPPRGGMGAPPPPMGMNFGPSNGGPPRPMGGGLGGPPNIGGPPRGPMSGMMNTIPQPNSGMSGPPVPPSGRRTNGGPPPRRPTGGKGGAPSRPTGGGGGRGGLLSEIQMGARLKPTVTNDRSAPII